MSAQPAYKELTYLDYIALPSDGKRYELIHGAVYAMAGAGRRHQRTVLALAAQLFPELILDFAAVALELDREEVV